MFELIKPELCVRNRNEGLKSNKSGIYVDEAPRSIGVAMVI